MVRIGAGRGVDARGRGPRSVIRMTNHAATDRHPVVRRRSPILRAMSKICHVCAKGPAFGHNRSHSMVATKRRFDPNLQRVRIDDGGTPRRVYVCTRCLKAGKITKAR
jgi:large subunit ribosomal protein L28